MLIYPVLTFHNSSSKACRVIAEPTSKCSNMKSGFYSASVFSISNRYRILKILTTARYNAYLPCSQISELYLKGLYSNANGIVHLKG